MGTVGRTERHVRRPRDDASQRPLLDRRRAHLYELGVNPLEADRVLVSPNAGTTVDVKRLVGVCLEAQDLLHRTDVGNPICGELITVEGVLGQSVADISDGSRAYITDYRRRARKIREMQVLQSYATKDAGGNMDLELVRAMVADLDRERATPGSMAQAVSDEKLAELFGLIANWNDPQQAGVSWVVRHRSCQS